MSLKIATFKKIIDQDIENTTIKSGEVAQNWLNQYKVGSRTFVIGITFTNLTGEKQSNNFSNSYIICYVKIGSHYAPFGLVSSNLLLTNLEHIIREIISKGGDNVRSNVSRAIDEYEYLTQANKVSLKESYTKTDTTELFRIGNVNYLPFEYSMKIFDEMNQVIPSDFFSVPENDKCFAGMV